VAVSLQVRKCQLNELDQLVDAEHISRVALGRKAISRLPTLATPMPARCMRSVSVPRTDTLGHPAHTSAEIS
jgi:hypothetical protein